MSEMLFKTTIIIHHCTGDWERAYYHLANSFKGARDAGKSLVTHPGLSWKSTKFVLDLDKLKDGAFIEVSRQETPTTTP